MSHSTNNSSILQDWRSTHSLNNSTCFFKQIFISYFKENIFSSRISINFYNIDIE